MTINIQNASNVTVVGHRANKNCKAVYNITTGEVYASVSDTADALGTTQGAVSQVVVGKTKTCKGMRLCYVSKMMDYLEEITEMNRIRAAKVAAYDAEAGRRSAIAKAEEDVQKYEAQVIELRRQLDEAESNIEFAKSELSRLKNNN